MSQIVLSVSQVAFANNAIATNGQCDAVCQSGCPLRSMFQNEDWCHERDASIRLRHARKLISLNPNLFPDLDPTILLEALL